MRLLAFASTSFLLASCGLVLDKSPPDSRDGGIVVPACDAPEDCDDGVFCNGFETCVSGTCQTIGRPNCADALACTNDVCVEATRTCRHLPTANACDSGEVCHPSLGCVMPDFCMTNEDCDDDNACTTEHCDPGMFCVYGDLVACPSDGCLRGVCDPETGACGTVRDDASCQDDVSCTVGECKSDGECRQAADDGLCEDAFDCTEDACIGFRVGDSTGCVHRPDDEVCRTANGLCYEEVCAPNAAGAGSERGCAVRVPPFACRNGQYCDFGSGDCTPLPDPANAIACDDGDPCNGIETQAPDMKSCVTTGGCPEPADGCLESVCVDGVVRGCGVRLNPDRFDACVASF